MKISFQSVLKFAFVAVLVAFSGVVGAQSADELKNQIEQEQSQLQNIEAEIQQLERELLTTQGEKGTLQNAIKKLNLSSAKISKNIEETQEEISRTTKTISRLDEKYQDLEERENLFSQTISNNIRKINELDQIAFVEFTLSSSISDVANQISIYQDIQENLQKNIFKLRRTKTDVSETKEERILEKEELSQLESEHKAQKKIVLSTKSSKNSLLKETKNKESNYQAVISQKIKLRSEFEKNLDSLESQLKFVLDPNTIPKPGDRVFSWPLDYILITQPFGRTADSARLYSYRKGQWSGRHTGVDFRANGDKIYAMASGEVVDFGDTDKTCPHASFGGWMLIKYNNGLSSIYSHLSGHVAKKGQKVKSGTLVAYSGNTGYSTGPHLDLKVVPTAAVTVETWPSKGCPGKNYRTPLVAGGTYLDPLNYLPKVTDDMFK